MDLLGVVDIFRFEDTNARLEDGLSKPCKPALLRITKASQTDSFLSASFRDYQVLTDTAMRGKCDELIGLKRTSS